MVADRLVYLDHKAELSQINGQTKKHLQLQTDAIPQNPQQKKFPARAWVASEPIQFAQIPLATRRPALIYKTIPAALEENLANNVQDNHYAFYKTPADVPLPVAVTEHAVMQNWQTALELHGIDATVMLPDIFAVPLHPACRDAPASTSVSAATEYNAQDTIKPALQKSAPDAVPDSTSSTKDQPKLYWSLWYEEKRCVLRTGKYEGFACDLSWMRRIMTIYQQRYQMHLLMHTPDVKKLQQDWPETADNKVYDVITTDHLFWQQLAKQAQDTQVVHSAINLLQHKYRRKSRWFSYVDSWRREIWLFVALLLCLLMFMMTNLYQTSRATKQLEQATRQLYFQLFPESKKINNLKAQTQNNIYALNQKLKRTQQTMWPVLQNISSTLQDCFDCTLDRMEMSADRLLLWIKQPQGNHAFIAELNKNPAIQLSWEIQKYPAIDTDIPGGNPVTLDKQRAQDAQQEGQGQNNTKPVDMLILDIRKAVARNGRTRDNR